MNRFGELLKEARKRAKLTQQVLADKVDVDDSYISKIEKGVFSPPSREVAMGLADALGISGKADRIGFLLAAGVASAEDVEGFTLVEVAGEEAPGGMQPAIAGTRIFPGSKQPAVVQPSQKVLSPSTLYHTPLSTSPQEILTHRLAVLEKKLEAAEKYLHDAHEELRELGALAADMFSKE